MVEKAAEESNSQRRRLSKIPGFPDSLSGNFLYLQKIFVRVFKLNFDFEIPVIAKPGFLFTFVLHIFIITTLERGPRLLLIK